MTNPFANIGKNQPSQTPTFNTPITISNVSKIKKICTLPDLWFHSSNYTSFARADFQHNGSKVYIYSAFSGDTITRSFDVETKIGRLSPGDTPIYDIFVSDNGERIAVRDQSGSSYKIYDASQPGKYQVLTSADHGGSNPVIFNSDLSVAYVRRTWYLLGFSVDRVVIPSLETDWKTRVGDFAYMASVAPDDQYLCFTTPAGLRVFDVKQQKTTASLGHTFISHPNGRDARVMFSCDSKTLFLASTSKGVRAHSTVNGEQYFEDVNHIFMAPSRDNSVMFAVTRAREGKVYDVSNWSEITSLGEGVNVVYVNREGTVLITEGKKSFLWAVE